MVLRLIELQNGGLNFFNRTKYRVEMNQADNESGSKAFDSLINYETVKVGIFFESILIMKTLSGNNMIKF